MNGHNNYKAFLENIPTEVAKIIGGNPDKFKHFKKEARAAQKKPELVKWAHWYYQRFTLLRQQPNVKLTDKNKMLAAYYILADLRDVIGKYPKEDCLAEHDNYEFEEDNFLISETYEEPFIDTRLSKIRLEEAIVRVKGDIETKIKMVSSGKAEEIKNQQPAEAGGKKKNIIRKILKIIVRVISAIVIGIIVAIVIDIFADFGWLQSIKGFIYSGLWPK